MNKPEIAKQLARRSRVSQGEAADALDRVLQKIVSDLRQGRQSRLPGLGSFRKGPDGRLVFDREAGKHD